MTVYLLKTEEAGALPREFCEKHFPGRVKDPPRLQSLGAGAMIWYLTKLPEKDIIYNPNGKPCSEKGPHFSISHSGGLIAGVSSDRPVGADIENMERKHAGIEKRVFSAEEINWIRGGGDERFFTAWTLKEACVKLFGKSLAEELNTFPVLPLIGSGRAELFDTPVFSGTLFIGDYAVSVCSEKEIPEVSPVFLTANDILKSENNDI